MATGPTASCLEDPKTAYVRMGMMHEYRPISGVNDARAAYAMPWGTTFA